MEATLFIVFVFKQFARKRLVEFNWRGINLFSYYICGMRIPSLTPTIPSLFFFFKSLICFDSNLLYLYRLLKYTLLNICCFLWHYAFNNNEWMSNPLNEASCDLRSRTFSISNGDGELSLSVVFKALNWVA